MRRRDRGSGWYVCFHTAGGREVRRAAGKSRRTAERIKAKIGTQRRESKFFNREQTSTWTLEQGGILVTVEFPVDQSVDGAELRGLSLP
jgi:hypothetical protein